jgi:hypothetical protein
MPDQHPDLGVVVRSLHEQYDEGVGAAVVKAEVRLIADRFAGATVHTFIPLLVRRYAAARLRSSLCITRRLAPAHGLRPGKRWVAGIHLTCMHELLSHHRRHSTTVCGEMPPKSGSASHARTEPAPPCWAGSAAMSKAE